jgi:hypothetical protein
VILPADILSDGSEFFSSFPSLSIGRIFLILEAGPDGIRLAYAAGDTHAAAMEFGRDVVRAWTAAGQPLPFGGALPSIGVTDGDRGAEQLIADLNRSMIHKGRTNRFVAVRIDRHAGEKKGTSST